MKKTLLFAFLLITTIKIFAQDAQPFLFPVVDGKVMYEKVVDVPGKDKLTIYGKVTDWYFKTTKNLKTEIINSDAGIGQFSATIRTDIDETFYMDMSMQVDCKDNKYRYRFFNIRHTVKGKENTPFFAKYLVNVPAETDNEIMLGQKKGFSKSQKGVIEQRMSNMDSIIKKYIDQIEKSINVKAEDF